MKKFLFSAIVALFAVSAVSAQDKGNWALGPRMNIYTNTGDAVVGLGAFGRYSFTDNWRIEPSLTALLHSGLPFPLALTLAFSAKESGFKACDTDVQAGVGFNDFTLAAIKEGNLRLRLSTVEYRLQWIQAGEYIITLCAP